MTPKQLKGRKFILYFEDGVNNNAGTGQIFDLFKECLGTKFVLPVDPEKNPPLAETLSDPLTVDLAKPRGGVVGFVRKGFEKIFDKQEGATFWDPNDLSVELTEEGAEIYQGYHDWLMVCLKKQGLTKKNITAPQTTVPLLLFCYALERLVIFSLDPKRSNGSYLLDILEQFVERANTRDFLSQQSPLDTVLMKEPFFKSFNREHSEWLDDLKKTVQSVQLTNGFDNHLRDIEGALKKVEDIIKYQIFSILKPHAKKEDYDSTLFNLEYSNTVREYGQIPDEEIERALISKLPTTELTQNQLAVIEKYRSDRSRQLLGLVTAGGSSILVERLKLLYPILNDTIQHRTFLIRIRGLIPLVGLGPFISGGISLTKLSASLCDLKNTFSHLRITDAVADALSVSSMRYLSNCGALSADGIAGNIEKLGVGIAELGKEDTRNKLLLKIKDQVYQLLELPQAKKIINVAAFRALETALDRAIESPAENNRLLPSEAPPPVQHAITAPPPPPAVVEPAITPFEYSLVNLRTEIAAWELHFDELSPENNEGSHDSFIRQIVYLTELNAREPEDKRESNQRELAQLESKLNNISSPKTQSNPAYSVAPDPVIPQDQPAPAAERPQEETQVPPPTTWKNKTVFSNQFTTYFLERNNHYALKDSFSTKDRAYRQHAISELLEKENPDEIVDWIKAHRHAFPGKKLQPILHRMALSILDEKIQHMENIEERADRIIRKINQPNIKNSFTNLYTEIKTLETLASQLHKNNRYISSSLKELAKSLKKDLDIFVIQSAVGGAETIAKDKWDAFKDKFIMRLHSQDDIFVGEQYRSFKHKSANILFALTGLGLILMAGRGLVTKLSTGVAQCTFFYNESAAMKTISQVQNTINTISIPFPITPTR